MSPVLDASVFIAAHSPSERHHALARRAYSMHPDTLPYLVPDLFLVEVMAAFARRGEPEAFLETVDALVRGPRFHAVAMDGDLLERAMFVARRARLRAYDAVYVALALARDAPLLTLDNEVIERSKANFDEFRLYTPG